MWSRSNGVVLCGATIASHHHVVVGVVPQKPWARTRSNDPGGLMQHLNSGVDCGSLSSRSANTSARRVSRYETAQVASASAAPPSASEPATLSRLSARRPTARPARTYASHDTVG